MNNFNTSYVKVYNMAYLIFRHWSENLTLSFKNCKSKMLKKIKKKINYLPFLIISCRNIIQVTDSVIFC